MFVQIKIEYRYMGDWECKAKKIWGKKPEKLKKWGTQWRVPFIWNSQNIKDINSLLLLFIIIIVVDRIIVVAECCRYY